MLFTTVNYIIFFMVVFLLYYVSTARRTQNFIILASSFIFYAYASPYFVLILLALSFIAYSAARLIENRSRKQVKFMFCLFLLLGFLAVFKYIPLANQIYNFFHSGTPVKFISVIYPVGLSFYLFQAVGYVTGVYWGKYEAERSFVDFLLYTSFFPQILQGPIAEYEKLSVQFKVYHDYKYENVVCGIQLVAWGFFKKLVIADNIAGLIGEVIADSGSYGGMTALFAMFLYSFQLYTDFSGYTDIAIGCSQMLGIELGGNFNCPYFSQSIAEFWRRWHISLGNWFREFLFYPLLRSDFYDGCPKKNKTVQQNALKESAYSSFFVHILVLCGVVARGKFLIYSAWLVPRLVRYRRISHRNPRGGGVDSKQPPVSIFRIIITFTIVTGGYILFAPADLSVSKDTIINITCNPQIHKFRDFLGQNQRLLSAVALGMIVLFIVDLLHYTHPGISIREWVNSQAAPVRYFIYIIGSVSVLMLGAFSERGVNEFAYFRF